MKMKKGKVYPSPPPSSSSDDPLSILSLLPATVLVLVSVLSPQDREVLAYLITRGTTISTRGSSSSSNKQKKNKSVMKNHKPPVFDCECFDCYTSYWFRWDSSPNRELIHQIIEAFEESCETSSSSSNTTNTNNNKSKRGKKKDKSGPRVGHTNNPVLLEVQPLTESHVSSPHSSPSRADVAEREPEAEESMIVPVAAATSHKGLARKVLPDLLGLFHSSFWRLWNPNA